MISPKWRRGGYFCLMSELQIFTIQGGGFYG